MARTANQMALDLVTGLSTSTVHVGLGTVPFKIADYTVATGTFLTAPPDGIRRMIITNKHATNVIGVGFSTNTSSPTLLTASSAGFGIAGEGLPIPGASALKLNVMSNISVWVVASAVSTPFQFTSFDSPLGLGG